MNPLAVGGEYLSQACYPQVTTVLSCFLPVLRTCLLEINRYYASPFTGKGGE
jgi:hypothetical protein